ncbi:DUF4226 domain-containing protein, partial [Nocardia sp. GCM10030253]|uniref:DUF4226 domain-containing protein n=1 Tax=Nocardia sp. GCM10030253 TaxID=3273404 RepID=UPI003631566B
MTSTEMSSPGTEFEIVEDDGKEGDPHSAPSTPWSQNKRARPGAGAPGQPNGSGAPPASAPGQNGVTAPGQHGATPPAPAKPGVAPATGATPGAVAPGQATPAGTAPVQAPPGTASPPPVVPQARHEPAPEPLIDPDLVEKALPVAAMAGTMAMTALPMIASALAGLFSGGGNGSGGTAPTEGATTEGQLSPESQRAMEVLKLLAKVYGDDETTDPEVNAIRKELGVTPKTRTGTGKTSVSIKARRLYQATAATAFNNLDNQLANYVTKLAGTNKVDKKAVLGLIREVNVALAELGTQAYTKQGQQKVRQILTAALQKAQSIVSGGNTNAT